MLFKHCLCFELDSQMMDGVSLPPIALSHLLMRDLKISRKNDKLDSWEILQLPIFKYYSTASGIQIISKLIPPLSL